ncbi:MAG: hypothetical protein R3F60_29450 [bacterium]
MSGLGALASLARLGGITVVTADPAGRVLVRSVIQPDGDLITVAVPDLSEGTVERHIARLSREVEAAHRLRRRLVQGLGVAVAGAVALSGGAMTDGEPGTWMAWLGGGCTAAPCGVGLVTLWRARRWLRARRAESRPRAALEAAEGAWDD